MNFFEKELRKIFWGDDTITSPFYMDGVCFGTLGRDYLVQIEFTASQIEDQFDVLKIAVVQRFSGQQNTFDIQLKDILGDKAICRGFEGTSLPYMWLDEKWDMVQLTWEERQQLRESVTSHLKPFRKQRPDQCTGFKLVYICAPLRGDVEKNIKFARQKAQEVFRMGDIPVCPYLMFPLIADPGNPAEDLVARNMGLQLVSLCQQLNVYGNVYTAGMQEEINLASSLGIPIKVSAGGR